MTTSEQLYGKAIAAASRELREYFDLYDESMRSGYSSAQEDLLDKAFRRLSGMEDLIAEVFGVGISKVQHDILVAALGEKVA